MNKKDLFIIIGTLLAALLLVGYLSKQTENKLILLESRTLAAEEMEKFNNLNEKQAFWADLLDFKPDGLVLKKDNGEEADLKFKDGYLKILAINSEISETDTAVGQANIYDNVSLEKGDRVLITLNSDNTIFSV